MLAAFCRAVQMKRLASRMHALQVAKKEGRHLFESMDGADIGAHLCPEDTISQARRRGVRSPLTSLFPSLLFPKTPTTLILSFLPALSANDSCPFWLKDGRKSRGRRSRTPPPASASCWVWKEIPGGF